MSPDNIPATSPPWTTNGSAPAAPTKHRSSVICDACYTQIIEGAKSPPHAGLVFRGNMPATSYTVNGRSGVFKNFCCLTCRTILLQYVDNWDNPGGFRLAP